MPVCVLLTIVNMTLLEEVRADNGRNNNNEDSHCVPRDGSSWPSCRIVSDCKGAQTRNANAEGGDGEADPPGPQR